MPKGAPQTSSGESNLVGKIPVASTVQKIKYMSQIQLYNILPELEVNKYRSNEIFIGRQLF